MVATLADKPHQISCCQHMTEAMGQNAGCCSCHTHHTLTCWQGVSVIVKTHTAHNPVVADITLSTEVGMMGALWSVFPSCRLPPMQRRFRCPTHESCRP